MFVKAELLDTGHVIIHDGKPAVVVAKRPAPAFGWELTVAQDGVRKNLLVTGQGRGPLGPGR